MGLRGGILGLFGLISPRIRRVIGVIVLVVALAMTAGAVVSAISDMNLRAHGVTINATVIDTRLETEGPVGHHSYQRQFEVGYTVGGKQYAQWLGAGRSQGVGSVVAVVYDPSNPSDAQLKSSLSGLSWLGPLILLLFAVLLGWLGTLLLRMKRRQPPEGATASGPDADNAFGGEPEASGNLFK